MPTFFLVLLEFTQEGFRRLEAIFRAFLWGYTEDGQSKVPLMAWHKLTRPKSEGGLGLLNFSKQAQALKLRHISKILEGHQSEWTWMVRDDICTGLRRGPLKQETKHWLVEEFLLLLPPIQIFSKITRGLLQGWMTAHQSLCFNPELSSIPYRLTIGQLYCLSLQGSHFQQDEYEALRLYGHSQGVFITQDLFSGCSRGPLTQRTSAIIPGSWQILLP
jgi:hypothetical protein